MVLGERKIESEERLTVEFTPIFPCRLFATDKSSDLIFFYWYVQNWMRLMIGGEYWVGGSVKDVSLVRKRKE